MKTLEQPEVPALTQEPAAAEPFDGRARVAYADAFRATAILLVVADHLIQRLLPQYVNLRVNLGVWAVDCFFVLSGFLLTRPYLEAALERRPFPSSRLFFARRFYRIWPLYAAATIVAALGQRIHGGHHVSLADVLAHLTMTHNFVPAFDVSAFNPPLWTMAVDADFYLLLPLTALAVLPLLRRFPVAQRVGLLFALCGAVAIASVVLRAATAFALPFAVTDPDTNFVLFRNVFAMGSAFVTGIVLALLTVLKTRIQPATAYAALGIGVAAGLGLFFIAPNTPVAAIFSDFIGGLSAGLLLFACLNGAVAGAGKIVHSKLVVSISALAYAIYLFHAPVLNTLYSLISGHHHRAHPGILYYLAVVVGTLAGTVLVAYLAHHFIEQPFLRRKDSLRESAP